jgi:hypothetical protein
MVEPLSREPVVQSDPLEDEVAEFAARFDPVPKSVLDDARAAFGTRVPADPVPDHSDGPDDA